MRRDPLDPVVAADLDRLDAALSGAQGADAALTTLVGDVRAVAPAPGPDFRAALDRRVDQGFRGTARAARRRPRSWERLLLPASGLGLAVVISAVVVAGLAQRGGDDHASSSDGGSAAVSGTAPSQAAGDSAGAGAGSAASAATPVPTAPAVPPAAPGRRVERDVRLELGARSDRFDAVTDGAVRATQRAGGFVATSEVVRSGRRGTATFVLRIPATRLNDAVADLSRLGHVRSIEQGTQDLTGAIAGTTARLRDARSQHDVLVAALATATGDQARRLGRRLDAVDRRIASLDRSRRRLEQRTSYATVDLTVVASAGAATPGAGGGGWTIGDAWHDAERALEIAAGAAIVGLAVGVPLALLAALALLAGRALARRRRAVALDRAA